MSCLKLPIIYELVYSPYVHDNVLSKTTYLLYI